MPAVAGGRAVIARLVSSILPLVVIVVGGWLAYRTFAGRRVTRRLRAAERVPVGELSATDGVVRVEGTVAADETTRAALLETDGVAVTTRVTERDSRPTDEDSEPMWNEVAADTAHTQFRVTDDTGGVEVRVPDEGRVALDGTTVESAGETTIESGAGETTIESAAGETPPAAARDVATVVDLDIAPDETRRFEQRVLEDGDRAVVVGEPTDSDVGLLFGTAEPFLLSDRSPTDLDGVGPTRAGYAVGGLLALLGILGVLALWL